MTLFLSLSPFPSSFPLFISILAVIKVSAAEFFSIRITQVVEHLIISCKTVPLLNVFLDPRLELVRCSGAQPNFSTDGIQFHSFVHCGGCHLVWVGLLWKPKTQSRVLLSLTKRHLLQMTCYVLVDPSYGTTHANAWKMFLNYRVVRQTMAPTNADTHQS